MSNVIEITDDLVPKQPPAAPKLPLKPKTQSVIKIPIKKNVDNSNVIKPPVTLFQITIRDIKKPLKPTLTKEPVLRAIHVKKTHNKEEIERLLHALQTQSATELKVKNIAHVSNVTAEHAFFWILNQQHVIGAAVLKRTVSKNKFIIDGFGVWDLSLLGPALLTIIKEAEFRTQLYSVDINSIITVEIEIYLITPNETVCKILEKLHFKLYSYDYIFMLSKQIEVKQLENRLMLQLFETNDLKFTSYNIK